MSNRDGREQWAGELPADVIEAMREDERPMWQVVAEAVEEHKGLFGTSTEDGYRRRIQQLENEIENIDSEIEDLKAEKKKRIEKKEEFEDRLQTLLENREAYHSRIDEILESISNTPGQNLTAHRQEIKDLASDQYGTRSEDNCKQVCEDIRDRVRETDFDIDMMRLRWKGAETGSQTFGAHADGGGTNLRVMEEFDDD